MGGGCDYLPVSGATCTGALAVGSNLRIGYDTSLASPGDWCRFSPRRTDASRAAIVVAAPALFDKSIEERETQAAESWRIHPVHASALEDRKQTLAILRFIAITNSGSDSGQLG